MHEWSIIMKSKTTDHDLNIRDTYSLIIDKYKFCQKGLSLTHVLSYGRVCVCTYKLWKEGPYQIRLY